MGTPITDLLEPKITSIKDLEGKTLVVDAHNQLYMFLTTIRGPDGSPLADSKGRTTSHLQGLFARMTKLLTEGLKLVFVFDGEVPELKKAELQKRREAKEAALKEFEAAKDAEDTQGMRKYAGRTTRLTPELIQESKDLLDALGIPWIVAPSEGEAQAARMVHDGAAYAILSQDADSLLFGADRMIKNLSISRYKKQGLKRVVVDPELITLSDTLNHLGLDQDQLICLAMLVGTDFNPGGIKGIGPKKALAKVKEFGNKFEELFADVQWNDHCNTEWNEVFYTFKKMPTTSDYELTFKNVNAEKVKEILLEREFSETRIDNTLDKLKSAKHDQKGLNEFF